MARVKSYQIIDGYTEFTDLLDTPSSYSGQSGKLLGVTGAGIVFLDADAYSGNTLDQAYDEGGAGAGKSITVDSGPVEFNASGANALNADGYISMSTISDPTLLSNKGSIYSKNDSGDAELFYIDDSGNIIQITKDGYLNGDRVGVHASGHITNGFDEIDGDKLDIDWTPSNYTPATTPTEVTSVDHLTAHLYGIDGYLAILGDAINYTHASTHITGATNEIDGDKLDIDWEPSNYVPDITPTEVDNADNLTAHLAGIDGYLLALGDDIETNSTSLTAHTSNTSNPHATDIENLGSGTLAELNDAITDATLIDKTALDSYAAITHASTHITGGSDEVDGDKLDIDWEPSNYTPTTSPAEVDSDDNLTAHLAGIDGYLLTLGNNIETNSTGLSTHTSNTANPHETTLDQAYDGSGSGAGKTITVDSGAVELDASGDEAMSVDGYISLQEISDPSGLSSKGILYTKDVAGTTELVYRNNENDAIQITNGQFLNEVFDGYSGNVNTVDGFTMVFQNGILKSVA